MLTILTSKWIERNGNGESNHFHAGNIRYSVTETVLLAVESYKSFLFKQAFRKIVFLSSLLVISDTGVSLQAFLFRQVQKVNSFISHYFLF